MNLKNPWLMRIGNVELSKYLEPNSNFGTNYFWNETLLGKMIPYNTLLYFNEEYQQTSEVFHPNGFIPISVLDINYNDDGNYPFKLVHTSPSFTNKNLDRFSAVLVYEVNKNYSLENSQ